MSFSQENVKITKLQNNLMQNIGGGLNHAEIRQS